MTTTQTKTRIFDKKNPLGCLENDSTKPWRCLETKLNSPKRLNCFAQINESSSQNKVQHFSLFSKNVRNPPKNIQNSLFSIRNDDTNCLDLKLKEISLENLLNVTGENCAKLIKKNSQHQQQQLHSSSQLPFDINDNLISIPSSLNIPSPATATNPLLFQCNFQVNSKQNLNQSAFPTTTATTTINETNPNTTNNSISNPIILQNLINAVVAQQHQQQQQQQEQKQKQILQAALIKLLLVTQNDDNISKLINILIGVLTGTNSDNNMSRYKTELCRNYEETGDCKYGKKCQFAHGSHELRNLQRHPKYKTELCRSYHNTGFCPYGLRCHFVHNVDETRTTNASTVTTTTTTTTNLQQQNMISKIFTNNIFPLVSTESQWSPNFTLLNKTNNNSINLNTSTNVVGSDGNGNDSLSIDTQNSEFKIFSAEISTNTSSGLGSSSSNSIDCSSSESLNSLN